jgi:hypothetical protein
MGLVLGLPVQRALLAPRKHDVVGLESPVMELEQMGALPSPYALPEPVLTRLNRAGRSCRRGRHKSLSTPPAAGDLARSRVSAVTVRQKLSRSSKRRGRGMDERTDSAPPRPTCELSAGGRQEPAAARDGGPPDRSSRSCSRRSAGVARIRGTMPSCPAVSLWAVEDLNL